MTTAVETRALDRTMTRAVTWNAAAKWTTQVLSWAATIIVARLLTPSDYGLIGMAGLYLTLAGLVSRSGISDAIVALRDLSNRQIAALNTVAILIGVACAVLSAAVAWPLASFFSTPALAPVLIVSGSAYLINGLQVVPRALLQRDLRFRLLASLETARVALQVVSTVALALLGFRYWSLVLGDVISSVALTLVTLCFRRHSFAIPALSEMGHELRFSGHVLGTSTSWYVYSNADFFVAGRMLGQVPLGYYTVAWNISNAPIDKIGNLITGVMLPFFSTVQKDDAALRRYVLGITEVLSYITVPLSVGLALVADSLVPALLGPKWTGAITPLRLLALYIAFRSLATVLPTVLTAKHDTRFTMWTNIAAAVLMPTAFFAGSHWGVNGIAMAWILMYPAIALTLFARVFRKIGLRTTEYFSTIAPALVSSGAMTVGVVTGHHLIERVAGELSTKAALLRLLLLVTLGTVAYLATLFIFYRSRLSRLCEVVRRSAAPSTA